MIMWIWSFLIITNQKTQEQTLMNLEISLKGIKKVRKPLHPTSTVSNYHVLLFGKINSLKFVGHMSFSSFILCQRELVPRKIPRKKHPSTSMESTPTKIKSATCLEEIKKFLYPYSHQKPLKLPSWIKLCLEHMLACFLL